MASQHSQCFVASQAKEQDDETLSLARCNSVFGDAHLEEKSLPRASH